MASIRFITAPIGGGKSLFGTIEICKELERTDRLIVTNIPLVLHVVQSPARTLQLLKFLSQEELMTKRRRAVAEKKAQLYWTLQEYCQVFIKRPINVAERLVCLTEEQTQEFWRYIPTGGVSEEDAKLAGCEVWRNESDVRPSYGYKLPNLPHNKYGFVPDFTFRAKHNLAVYYVIDEGHQHFPARFWQSQGPQVERYMSQLRKLNDDFDVLTQHPEKVDKNFRRNATDWLQVQNMGKASLWMGVSITGRFRYHWYNQAEMPSRIEKPTKSGWYRIDPLRRYHWLYKTAEGVGVSGGIVSEETRHKGRHWSVWLIPFLLIPFIAYFVPRIITGSVQKVVAVTGHSMIQGFQNGVSSIGLTPPTSPGPVPKPVPAAVPPVALPKRILLPASAVRSTNVMNSSSVPPAEPVAPVFVRPPPDLVWTAKFFDGTNVAVHLSDGHWYRSENGEVQGVGDYYVRVGGYDKIPRAREQ